MSAMTTERKRNTHTRGRGRPEIAIGEDQLCFLIEQGYKILQICLDAVGGKVNRYNISAHNYSAMPSWTG